MDLTPQVINEVEFSMARRGYDPDQVDEFLEKVAAAVGELNAHMAELRERMSASERRAAELERRASERPERVVEAPAGPSAADINAAAEAELETMKRTLLLAQRTADAAVREAEADARRIVAEAEEEARTAHEATRQAVLEELAALEAARDALREDVDAMEAYVGGQRDRLVATIADLQRLVDDPDRLRALTPPEPSPVELPAEVDDVAEAAAPAEEPRHERQPTSFTVAQDLEDPALSGDDDDAWARFSMDDDIDAGPDTEPVLRLDRVERGAGGDDAYLSELRKAMLDDTGAPVAADIGLFDDVASDRAARSTRFGRRR